MVDRMTADKRRMVITVGTGGGSLVWCNEEGKLRQLKRVKRMKNNNLKAQGLEKCCSSVVKLVIEAGVLSILYCSANLQHLQQTHKVALITFLSSPL